MSKVKKDLPPIPYRAGGEWNVNQRITAEGTIRRGEVFPGSG
jgi:hypothetical protein